MTENRFKAPLEEFLSTAQVPVADQVEIQPEPQQPPADWSPGTPPYGDGMSGDADGGH
jgi:hypothetical protein